MAPKGYSSTQIALHWGIALLIGVNLIFEDWIKAGWESIEEGGPAIYSAGSLAHIGVGVSVLLLACWRGWPATTCSVVLRVRVMSRPY